MTEEIEEKNRPISPWFSSLAIFGDSLGSLLISFGVFLLAAILANYYSTTNYSENDALWQRPGDLDAFFRRIIAQYQNDRDDNLTILSKPPQGSWILQIDNFLSNDEVQHLIELGQEIGYRPSGDVLYYYDNDEQQDPRKITSMTQQQKSRRTSSTAWCSHSKISQNITQRIVQLTQIPLSNAEPFQLLRYETGQYYQLHSDFIPHSTNKRILTLFIYLSSVEEGGATQFSSGLTIAPQRGRLLLWPNVDNRSSREKNVHTRHQALPVTKGIKYAANVWFHEQKYNR